MSNAFANHESATTGGWDGRAFIEVNKKRTYLGKFGFPEAEERYRVALIRLLSGTEPAPKPEPKDQARIHPLAERYLEALERSYQGDELPIDVCRPILEFARQHRRLPVETLCPYHIEFEQCRLLALDEWLPIETTVTNLTNWISTKLVSMGTSLTRVATATANLIFLGDITGEMKRRNKDEKDKDAARKFARAVLNDKDGAPPPPIPPIP